MRLLCFLISAASLVGCNAILGIEEARLGDASAGAAGQTAAGAGGAGPGSGGAGAGGSSAGAGGGACSLMAPDPCNQCVAARCCAEYDACLADSDCKAALTEYNVCIGTSVTNDAGGTCDETLGASGNPRRSAFARCAFQKGPADSPPGCADVCFGNVVGGDICSDYCTCVADACPEKGFDGQSCLSVCAAFNEGQINCRPYHCGLAKAAKNNNNESDRLKHCGHAFGEALCP
jgi:hypothetical protein